MVNFRLPIHRSKGRTDDETRRFRTYAHNLPGARSRSPDASLQPESECAVTHWSLPTWEPQGPARTGREAEKATTKASATGASLSFPRHDGRAQGDGTVPGSCGMDIPLFSAFGDN
jgi:hypothetical protein